MPNVLVVAAHPDDEVLGFGATGASMVAGGSIVRACILSGGADVRTRRPSDAELMEDTLRAQQILGFETPILGDFPNIRFNTVPHLELVQFIERAIAETHADVVVTHHPGDLNDDHLHVSRATMAAARYFQRRDEIRPLTQLMFMEVPSSTDWSFATGSAAFQADTFYGIEATLPKKLEALAAYRRVMRQYPHPRSKEAIEGLAAYRGGQSGLRYAEAFQTAFRRIPAGA